MRRLLQALAIAIAITALWFAVWHSMMAPHVARVEASMGYHQKRLRTVTRALQFPIAMKAEKIYATGFPFKFQVAVKGFSMSMVEIDETFAISVPMITLESNDSGQGVYRVNLPNTIEALYAKQGSAPEDYIVTADAVPKLNLSAADSKNRCGALTGKRCEPVAEDAPLISYAVGVPKSITLKMTLGSESRTEGFPLAPMDINVPIYREIPADMNYGLHIFVGVLREALVFKTPSGTNQ